MQEVYEGDEMNLPEFHARAKELIKYHTHDGEILQHPDYLTNSGHSIPNYITLVDLMAEEIQVLRDVIVPAKVKLEIYRKNSSGEYLGGMEYSALITKINKGLAEADATEKQIEVLK